MFTIPETDPHTKAVIAALETSGFQVGDGVAPSNIDPPYLVVYLISTPPPSGSLWDWQADVILRYQVVGVGVTAEQARQMVDVANNYMTKANISVSGRTVQYVQLDLTIGDMREERTIPAPIYTFAAHYLLATTPT